MNFGYRLVQVYRPKFLQSNVHAVCERCPEILYTCLMCPCRAFYECFLFARYFGLCIFGVIVFGSCEIPHLQQKKKRKKEKAHS